MALLNEFNEKIKQYMKKKKDTEHLEYCNMYIAVFKSVKAKASAIAKEDKSEITDEIMLKAIRKECKELKQTLENVPQDCSLWREVNSQYQAINPYLPKEVSDSEVLNKVKGIVMTMPTCSNFGLYMKVCIKQLKDIEPCRIAKALKELLK